MGEIIGTVFPAWEPGNLIFAISCLFSLLSVSVWPLFVAELMHCIVFHHEVDRKGRDALELAIFQIFPHLSHVAETPSRAFSAKIRNL